MNAESDDIDFQQAARLISTRQIFHSSPKTLGRMAARVISKHGVAAEQATDELTVAWEKIAGDEWSKFTSVGPIKQGKLEIIVANSLVNQQLTFEKKRLLKEINQELRTTTIKDFQFRIGPVAK